MMNYIRSELYRTIKNRNFKIMCVVFTILIVGFVLVLDYMTGIDENFPYGNTRFSLSNVYMGMIFIFTLVVIFSAMMDNGEVNTNTIKHSIAFGISRNTIYIGRFIVQAIVGILVYISMSILLIFLSFLLLKHSNANEINIYIRVTMGASSCLLAVLAVSHFFIMNVKNQAIALIFPVIIMVVAPGVINMIGRKLTLIKSIAYYLPYNLVESGSKLVQGGNGIGVYGLPLVVGIVWIIIFILGGIYIFNKKEIK